MALEPKVIDLGGLPRTIGGGLKREPVEELLKRVQREYATLYYEHKQLKEDVERRAGQNELSMGEADAVAAQLEVLSEGIERRDAELASLRETLARRDAQVDALRLQPDATEVFLARAEIERRDAELAALRETLAEREAEVDALRAQPDPGHAPLGTDEIERRDAELAALSERLAARDAEVSALKEQVAAAGSSAPGPLLGPRLRPPDDAASLREIELARIVLEGAHRTSIELRESTRRECELMLRKTRTRVRSLETEFERTKDARLNQLAELEAMTAEIREQMRITLAALGPLYLPQADEVGAGAGQGLGPAAAGPLQVEVHADEAGAGAENGAGPEEDPEVPDVASAADVDAAF